VREVVAELLDPPDVGQSVGNVAVTGVTHDSRAVQPGDLYAGLPGSHTHGARFSALAAESGAVAVLTDEAGRAEAEQSGLPVVMTSAPRRVLGPLASAIYGRPSDRLRLIGVTGTNGKTTVAYLVEAGLRSAGLHTGLLGTVETRVGQDRIPSVRTTPEAPDLQALLAVMAERGAEGVAMEVSSHALELGRVGGCRFRTAGFTNLSQDHLDFHGSLENYFAAKASLFVHGHGTPQADVAAEIAVINSDDPYGQRLLELRRNAVSVGEQASPDGWQISDVAAGPAGSAFMLRAPERLGGTRTPAAVRLPGSFNVANAAIAIALLVESGVPLAEAVAGVAGLEGVPGRMERVDEGQPFLALVDYAHTPRAVEGLLTTVRQITSGQVISVLGCGGDRDAGKRPLMGEAVARLSDVAVLTNDNPRSEDPAVILAAMEAGARSVTGGARLMVIPDRAAAIAAAVSEASAGDAVVVAGKGHETGQEQDGRITPFDDRKELRSALGRLGGSRGSNAAGAARAVRPA
jgi:UDP-N-acetylmuramoyl-L-alanyl-D-glutamate--2,6-diaminopimelate ligase